MWKQGVRCLCKFASQREEHTRYLLLCLLKDCCSLTSNSGFHTVSCWGLGEDKDGEGMGQFVTFHPSRYTAVALNASFSEQRACEKEEFLSERRI
jgi:hypothetical protein